MDYSEIILLLVAGIITGIAGGLFGIGGGTVIVPILIFLLSFTQLEAQGTSLAAMLLPVGIFGVLRYKKAGIINLRVSLLIGFGLLLGAWPGAKVANLLPEGWLKLIYALFLFYVAWRFIEPMKTLSDFTLFISNLIKKRRVKRGIIVKENIKESFIIRRINALLLIANRNEGETRAPIDNWYWMFGLGFIGGIASGLFGIGGGAIIVPFLTLIFRFDHQDARVISLGALLPPVGLFGMLPYISEGHVEVTTALPVAIGIMGGAFVGALVGVNIPKRVVKLLYGLFLIWIACNYFFKSIDILLF